MNRSRNGKHWGLRARAMCVLVAACVVMPAGHMVPATTAATAASVPTAAPATATAGSNLSSGPLELFMQSIDLFTIILVLGSIVSVAVIIQCVWEIRSSRVMPGGSVQTIDRLARAGRWTELLHHVSGVDDSFVARVVHAAIRAPGEDRTAMRDAAELVASDECARWFRKIEPLNIVGNLGPLLGLAGTVWGMIIAFTSLGEGGGQANPGELALGISKALFHTLLGLMLAVPSLLVFGFYRTRVDKHCTRAMIVAGEIVEMLPTSRRARGLEP